MPTQKEIEEKLKEIYYNPRTGFQTKHNLYKSARSKGIQVSEGNYLRKMKIYEII
jgi:hypothetical protein